MQETGLCTQTLLMELNRMQTLTCMHTRSELQGCGMMPFSSCIIMQSIVMASFNTPCVLSWLSCFSLVMYLVTVCWVSHKCYWWFKQRGSLAFLITPVEEEVIILDNTVICHIIFQHVPIKKEPLSSFSRCNLSATNTSLFCLTLCQHKWIVILQVNFFYHPMLSLRVCNGFMHRCEPSLGLSITAVLFEAFVL